MSGHVEQPVGASIVKQTRVTPRMPKGSHRKSTGFCKCGAPRHNPQDAYCKACRKQASANGRLRAREELQRLRSLANELNQKKGHDNECDLTEGQLPAAPTGKTEQAL